MKNKASTAAGTPATRDNVMQALSEYEWEPNQALVYDVIEDYDRRRQGGSRVSTAREIIQELNERCVREKSTLTGGNSLTLVLNWLYYRRGSK